MKILDRVRKAAATWVSKRLTLSGVDSGRGWTTIFSSANGWGWGWQTDNKLSNDDLVKSNPVYACATLIASDVGKVPLRLMTLASNVWSETISPAFTPVLRKPNKFQTRQQFIETWVVSKLFHGNTYALKGRDARGVVNAMYVLDPNRVTPLVAQNGDVYYQLQRDDLSRLPNDMPAVPASEIIHDRMECLFHPLVGISPLIAAALSAEQGMRILQNSERFFRNQSRPGGFLTAPGTIDDETAKRLKEEFEKEFAGKNIGRLFVGGDGLEYKPLAVNAENSQLVEQLKLSAEQVCSAFHVPAYMIGAGPAPTYESRSALNDQYYSQCLQKLFNAIEDLLDDGLDLTKSGYRTEFDPDDLLRMDKKAQAEVIETLSKAGVMSPNEGRSKFGLLPVAGGDTPYLQQQNYSLAALEKRDAKDDPFAKETTPPQDQTDKALHLLFSKSAEDLIHV
jgi:HK97 family phage portal protein